MINTPYVKKDSVSNYFPVPNAVFDLELHHIEIDIYAYLMRIENRRTYQCLASYPTIARKLGLSVNTVAKYVAALEEHGLIRTERTEIVTKEGLKRNGCLKYTILPIQEAINQSYERQMVKLEEVTERQRVAEELRKQGRVHPCEPLCAAFPGAAGTDTAQLCLGGFGPVSEAPTRTKVEAG